MGLRALEVEVLDSSGKHLATHPRAYGQASTNSEDPSMQLALLCNKPASWPNSRVRDALPDPLREWLDRQDRQTRNEALQTLKRVDRESGWANAVEAMLSILESTGGADVLLQCLFDRFGSVFPQCGLMVFPGVVIVSR